MVRWAVSSGQSTGHLLTQLSDKQCIAVLCQCVPHISQPLQKKEETPLPGMQIPPGILQLLGSVWG